MIMFVIISGADQTPVSNGSGDVSTIPGIWGSDDIRIAGNIAEIRLISTIDTENKKTIQNNEFLVFCCESDKSLKLLLND